MIDLNNITSDSGLLSGGGMVDSVPYSVHRANSGMTYFITTPEHAREIAKNNGWSAELLARVLEAHERQLTKLARTIIENGL